MGRGTLGEVRVRLEDARGGPERDLEGRDSTEDPRGDPGRVGGPLGRYGLGGGPLGRFGTGRRTHGVVQDGSLNSRGGSGRSGDTREVPDGSGVTRGDPGLI